MTDDDLAALLEPEWEANRCGVAQHLDRIEDEARRAKVAVAARDSRVPVGNVMEALVGLVGTTPEDQTIRRHRNLKCKCPRD